MTAISKRYTRAAMTCCLVTLSASASPVLAISFQGVGVPAGLPASEARGVSDDGQRVVVLSDANSVDGGGGPGTSAFVWEADSGLTPVPSLPGSNFNTGFAISGDGQSVVGGSGTWGTPFESYRSGPGGLLGLGDLAGGRVAGQAFGVSADGGVVVGFSEVVGPDQGGPLSNAFKWTDADGVSSLGTLPGDDQSQAFGVSRDGQTIVGFSGFVDVSATPPVSDFSPTLWDAAGAAQDLGYIGGVAGDFGRANAVSDNGVVVGGSNSPDAAGFFTEAFRWTEADGMAGLGDLPGDAFFFSSAEAASADGSIIVGQSTSGEGVGAFGIDAFYWTEETGMIRMADALEAAGLDLAGWSLTNVFGVTPDGLTFVGSGVNPDGVNEGWIATIPEPAGVVLLVASAAAGLVARRR